MKKLGKWYVVGTLLIDWNTRFIVLFVIAAKELIASILDCVANNIDGLKLKTKFSMMSTKI
jgi:hypothetical protein